MKLNSGLLSKAVLVANLVLVSMTAASTNALAGAGRDGDIENYKSQCSFYGQNQRQAQTITCSIKQSPNQITISWGDGFTTNLIFSGDGNWRSMPSKSEAKVRFYAGNGRVAHVEILAGPGKGIIVINP
jgi:predicted small secreted protein